MTRLFVFVLGAMLFSYGLLLSPSHAALGFFKKKPKPVAEEKLSKDDKIGFVDRTEKDLARLKNVKVFVSDAIDANCAYKIKSVLQDNQAIYKVIPTDFKNYLIYFNEGQPVDTDMVTTLITAAGYKSEIKP